MKRNIPGVVNVVACWQEMAGDNDDLKKLNSFLTDKFIGHVEMPCDECESEAVTVYEIWLASEEEEWREQVEHFLVEQFASDEGGRLVSKAGGVRCRAAVRRIDALLHGGPWPDAEAQKHA